MIGGCNPYPRQIGGHPSLPLRVHKALRAAVGGREGGGAGKAFWDGGLEDRWRWIRALLIARVVAATEQASLEFIPSLGSHWLSFWELTLGVDRAPSQYERQLAIKAALTVPASAVAGEIQAYLREQFTDDITVGLIDRVDAVETVPHKALADRTGLVPFGPMNASVMPNFSDGYIVKVTWPGLHTEDELEPMREYLCRVLPSWVDFEIQNGIGFVLGGGDGLSKLGRRGMAW